MNNNLNGKTAIVCGSTDGIGKSIATLMSNRGCEIILVARNQDKLDSTLAELNTNQKTNKASLEKELINIWRVVSCLDYGSRWEAGYNIPNKYLFFSYFS